MKVNGAYYCDVLLLKQLLADICQAAGDFYFPTRAPSCCDTRLWTSHQTRAPNRTDLSSVDYRLLKVIVIQECVCQKQQEISNIADELWLTEYFINRMTY